MVWFLLREKCLERKQQRFKRCWFNSRGTLCALEQVNRLTWVGSELLIYKRKHGCHFRLLLLNCLDCKLFGAETRRGLKCWFGPLGAIHQYINIKLQVKACLCRFVIKKVKKNVLNIRALQ